MPKLRHYRLPNWNNHPIQEKFMLTKYLYVFFISMVPLVELRGAIPIGTVGLGLPMIPSPTNPIFISAFLLALCLFRHEFVSI